MRNRWGILGIGLLLALLAGGGGLRLLSGPQVEDGILLVNGRIEGDEITVASKVAGRVVELRVREGDRVERGRLIARVSSEQIQARLEEAEARWRMAREEVQQATIQVRVREKEVAQAETAVRLAREQSAGQIGQAQAALETAMAHLQEKEADLEKAGNDHHRYTSLYQQGVVSAQLRDSAKADHEVARSRTEAARKQLKEAEATLRLAQTTAIQVELRQRELESAVGLLEQARAALTTAQARADAARAARAEAKATLADTVIQAPVSGTVATKVTDLGEYVVPGTPIVVLVDLGNLHLKTYVKETEIGKIRLGAPGRVWVDAFPGRPFPARVSEVSPDAEFTPKSVDLKEERVKLVFGVKLAVENPEGYLKPGMPADGQILWKPGASWGERGGKD